MMEGDGENECPSSPVNVSNNVNDSEVTCSSPLQSPPSALLDDNPRSPPGSPDGNGSGNENMGPTSPEGSNQSNGMVMMDTPDSPPAKPTNNADAQGGPESPDTTGHDIGNECTSISDNVNNSVNSCSSPPQSPPPQSPPASPSMDDNPQSPPGSPPPSNADNAPPQSPDNPASGNQSDPEEPKSPEGEGSNHSNGRIVIGTPISLAEESQSQSCSSPLPQSPPASPPTAPVVDSRQSPPPASPPSVTADECPPGSPDASGSENEAMEEPKSPEGSQQSNGMLGTPISLAEESQSQSSPPPPPAPKEVKAKKKAEKVAPKKMDDDDIEEGEDLEDGEIEDEEEDEDEEMEVEEVVEIKKVKPSRRESSSGKSSSSKNKEREKEKSPEKKSSKRDKEINSKEELDPVKRLLAEVREKDNLEREEREKRRKEKKRPHKEEKVDKPKEKDSKKKKPRLSEEEDEGEEFLFVRGASPGAGGNGENWDVIDLDRRGGSAKRRRESDEGASPASHRHRRGHEGSSSPTRNNNRAPERPKSQRQERREPKSDVICAYFMQGKCQKSSDQCNFSHDAVPPRKMELCKFWMMECCAKKEKCIYLHNDFPCKYFHTGLVCRMGDNCKFSHNPLSDVTKQVLLKHIETAPKEILGDFPRLNRNGALNLINKMEAKLKGLPYDEEENNENEMMNHGGGSHHGYGGQDRHGSGGPPDRHGHGGPDRHNDRHHHNDRSRDSNNRGHFGGPGHHDSRGGRGGGHDRGGAGRGGGMGMPPSDLHRGGGGGVDNRDRRQSRWEQSQPTRVDQEKLKELMNEAGIAGFYKETMEDSSRPNNSLPPQLPAPTSQSQMFPQQLQNMQPPLMGMLPSFLLSQAQAQQGMQQQVNNPALANVLAQLQIPSTSIVPPQFPPPFDPGAPTTSTIDQGDENKSQQNKSPPQPESGSSIPDNLPKMQRELFERIQQQQKKNQNKVQTQASIEPEEPEENWYSDDEEEDSKKKEELKAEINDQISSVLNQIRQQSQQQSSNSQKEPESLKTFFGDTDLRSGSTASSGFKDVDLRTSSALFKKINILPATEINGSISSHEPVVYKVLVVTGALEKPDYSSVRGSLTPQAILMDPRLGPRRRRSNSIPAPESPTLDMHTSGSDQPMSILDSTPVFDPRTMKGGGGPQLSGGRGLLETPNPFDSNSMPGMNMHMNDFNNPFNRDPRAPGGNPPSLTQQPPPNPANAAQLAQNFAAVSALMQQQWPNGQPAIDPSSLFMLGLSGGFPFMPQAQGSQGQGSQPNPAMDFGLMQQNHGMRMRPPFMPGNQQQQQSSNHQQQAPPASSWERFNRGQGNLSPPL